MTEISERYRRLSDQFAARIAAVPDDGWSNQSPCEEWTARDVVKHVVETQGMFLGFVNREIGPLPAVEDDPAAAWDAARARVQAELDDPERANVEFDGQSGRSTLAKAVDKFINLDLVVHGWDLAHATGQDDRIPDEDIHRVMETADSLSETLRSSGACGPAIDVPDTVDDQTKLLAYLGRRA